MSVLNKKGTCSEKLSIKISDVKIILHKLLKFLPHEKSFRFDTYSIGSVFLTVAFKGCLKPNCNKPNNHTLSLLP